MSTIDIQRAWRDGEYFLSLSDAERSMIPNSPAGAIDLGAGELSPLGVCRDTQQSWCNVNSACTSKCMCVC